jgi:Ni,Fe-hydrogenase I large subunit
MWAALQMQQSGQNLAMQNRADLLKYMSQISPAVSYTDVWGQKGAANVAKDAAEINYRNQQAMQKALDPQGFQIAEDTRNRVAQMVSPSGQKALANQQFTQRTLPGMYGTGLDPRSTIYGSGLFDANTLQGLELQQKLANIGQSYGAANPAPKVGIDPGVAASIASQEGARAADRANAFTQNIFQGAGNLQQGYEQGMNSLYSNMGQAIQTAQANQLAAQQANRQAIDQTNQSQAGSQGGLYQGIGALGGGILGSFGGPLGTAAGSYFGKSLGGMAGGQSAGQATGFGR